MIDPKVLATPLTDEEIEGFEIAEQIEKLLFGEFPMTETEDWQSNLVGMDYEEAKSLAKTNGWVLRARNIDGVAMFGTTDFRTDRLNISTVDGKVSSIGRVG